MKSRTGPTSTGLPDYMDVIGAPVCVERLIRRVSGLGTWREAAMLGSEDDMAAGHLPSFSRNSNNMASVCAKRTRSAT
jgi:hypothetical protein